MGLVSFPSRCPHKHAVPWMHSLAWWGAMNNLLITQNPLLKDPLAEGTLPFLTFPASGLSLGFSLPSSLGTQGLSWGPVEPYLMA